MKEFKRSFSERLTAVSFFLILLLLPAVPSWAEEEEKREFAKEMVDGDWLYHVLEFDAIPPVDDPVFVSRKAAEAFMTDEEPVLGLVIGGEARAYSIWHLDAHEIVNDTVGNRPIAVTW